MAERKRKKSQRKTQAFLLRKKKKNYAATKIINRANDKTGSKLIKKLIIIETR